MRVRTEALHFDADQKLLDFIDEKINKLTRFHDQILDAKVVLKLENNSSKIKDKVVEVHLQVPGDIVIAKADDKTFEAAVASAADTLERNLKKQKSKLTNRN
ncbi:MAG: ribosome-associated translation inhibitor RaiA [Bacteroidota bacterium]